MSGCCGELHASGTCGSCGKQAKLRCSRCHHRFFCGIVCQKNAHEMHKRECYPLDISLLKNQKNKMMIDAVNRNLFAEYKAMGYYIERGRKDTRYVAEHMIYGAVIEWILVDPEEGDFPDPEKGTKEERIVRRRRYEAATEKMKEAGRMLSDAGMEDEMRNYEHNPFIPQVFKREIDLYWDGKGGWASWHLFTLADHDNNKK